METIDSLQQINKPVFYTKPVRTLIYFGLGNSHTDVSPHKKLEFISPSKEQLPAVSEDIAIYHPGGNYDQYKKHNQKYN